MAIIAVVFVQNCNVFVKNAADSLLVREKCDIIKWTRTAIREGFTFGVYHG